MQIEKFGSVNNILYELIKKTPMFLTLGDD